MTLGTMRRRIATQESRKRRIVERRIATQESWKRRIATQESWKRRMSSHRSVVRRTTYDVDIEAGESRHTNGTVRIDGSPRAAYDSIKTAYQQHRDFRVMHVVLDVRLPL